MKKYYIQYVEARGGYNPEVQKAKIETTDEDLETLLDHPHVHTAKSVPMNTPVGEVVLNEDGIRDIIKDGEVVGEYKPKVKKKKEVKKEEEVETEKEDPVKEEK